MFISRISDGPEIIVQLEHIFITQSREQVLTEQFSFFLRVDVSIQVDPSLLWASTESNYEGKGNESVGRPSGFSSIIEHLLFLPLPNCIGRTLLRESFFHAAKGHL
jgi:hypothetical protein